MRGAVVALLILLMLVTPAMAVSPGLPPVIVPELPNGCVLAYDFSPDNIYYNATDGYYYVKDLSGNGNDGRIYGLTGNVLSNATAIDGNGTHYITFPYYNNITQANLTVYWNTTGILSDVSVTVYLNGNLLGSFVALANTTGSYTFTNVQSYILVNATNTISYSANNTITIEKTEFDYDHDLTLVQTEKGWALYFDGVNDYIVQGVLLGQSYTIEAIVKPDKTDGLYGIFSKVYGRQSIYISNNYLWVSVFYGNVSYDYYRIIAFQAVEPHKWYTLHLIGSYESQYIKVYSNNDLKWSLDLSSLGYYPDRAQLSFIGGSMRYVDGSWKVVPFSGWIVSVRGFTTSIGESQIKLSYEFIKPHKFSSQPTMTQIRIPVIDISNNQTISVQFQESTTESNAYLPIPVAARNINPANWVYTVDGDVLQFDDNRYINASSVTFEIPLQIYSNEISTIPTTLVLDSDSKTFEFEKSVTIHNPSDISIMATLSVDPSTIGVAQAYLDGSPMSLFNGSLVSSIIIGPGESKVMELTATLPISKQELEFRATLNDFFEIDSFDEAMTLAQTLAQSATEGKIETVAKVIAIDSADFKSFGNRTVIIPLDVKASDVIEAKALTGSKELLEVREGKDGKAEIVVPATVFEGTPLNTQHAEIKVIYNKKPAWWERLPFLKNLGGIFEFLSKLFGFGR